MRKSGHGTNIIAGLKQVRCKGMSQSMTVDLLGNPGLFRGFFNMLLQAVFVNMMTTQNT